MLEALDSISSTGVGVGICDYILLKEGDRESRIGKPCKPNFSSFALSLWDHC
jgi:hypothetical protein